MPSRRSFPWPWVLAGAAVIGGGTAAAVILSRRQPMLAPADVGGGRQLLGPTPENGDPDSEGGVKTPPVASGKPVSPDDATDDETVLARMLASEVSEKRKTARDERIVIGWLTVQRARRHRGMSLYRFVTSGKGYGPQWEDRYAATSERPTAITRALARELLAGTVQPSAAIRRHRPGSWVERKQGLSDDALLLMQQNEYLSPKSGKPKKGLGEGIYAQVSGTRWVLYSTDSPKISLAPFKTATARLDALATVPAVDSAVS